MDSNGNTDIITLLNNMQAAKQEQKQAATAVKPPDSKECIAALVLCDVNIHWASERLGLEPEQLLACIASDPTAPALLAMQLRTLSMIKTAALTNRVEAELASKLGIMDGYDLSKTYTSLVQRLFDATDPHESTQNINVNEVVMAMIPAPAREALRQLSEEMTAGDQPTVIENTVTIKNGDN